jgi:D-serine dehydratase
MTAVLDGRTKGLAAGVAGLGLAQVGRAGWNVLAEDLPLPLALLKDSALRHNSAWMRRFLAATGVALAPHGKTTMSPQLFARQLADGAWGITVATVQQLRVCREHGIARVLLANQLVGRQAIAYVLDELARDPAFDFYALADSVDEVDALAAAARARRGGRRLQLLVECGVDGGRTGCRTLEQALAVARSIAAARDVLALAGVEGYEGSVPGATPEEQERNITRFVAFMAEVAAACADARLFDADPVLLSAGGSAFFDLAATLPKTLAGRPTQVVLRSGCYLTHDTDVYARAFERMRDRTSAVAALGEGLREALGVWAYVQSTPEPGLAILTMGKRDVSHDLALPFPRWHFRPGPDGVPAVAPAEWKIAALNDQHAYLRTTGGPALRVGDMIGCAISHPCTTFDKWRFLPIVDDRYTVVDAVVTCF